MSDYNFDTFLTDYQTKALQFDLAKEYPLVYEILEKQKIKLSSADFDEVIEEVIEFCKKAIKTTKESLTVSFLNKHYTNKYENGTPTFLPQMKTYIEYGNLYKEAIRKKESNQLIESDKVLKNKKNHNQQMDYIDIILRGYLNENDKQFLSKYFIRESKKAEKELYSFDEFFAGLDNAINKFKIEYKNRLYKRKNELYLMKEGAENGTLTYRDLKGESIKERNKKTIEYCESELSEISFENYPIGLLYFTNNRFTGHLNYSEVEFIENEIAKAFEELKKNQQPETTQQEKEIDIYFKSYKHNFFSSLINKRNEDNKENALFYGKRTLELKNKTDKELQLIENLKDRYDLLSLYNNHLHYLITHTIQLYKTINEYHDTNNIGHLTIIEIKKDEVFNSLKSIKGFSEKIKDDVIDGNTDKAIRIKTYFLSKLDVLIAFLDNTIGIDIYKSPLQKEFEKVKYTLENAINLDELKIINELNQNKTATQFDFSETSTVEKNIIIIKEKNSEMFSNNGFELFEYILNEHVKPKETKGRKSDLIYYYWEMHKSNPQYIHQRPATFFKWFDKEYNETTGQLKTYDNVKTDQRKKDYSTALDWFKSKNK